MQRLWTLLLTAALVAAAAPAALAQADAQAAYQQAKSAYQAAKFSEARDLAKKAAETDAKNPEVFLLLGKAHYQLGELDDAVAAWKQTLALAPEEPFAKKMLEGLQGQRLGVETRIKLVEVMIRERLPAVAYEEVKKLLADKALSDDHRMRLMRLKAESLIRLARPGPEGHDKIVEAQKTVAELTVLYPKQADDADSALLLGQIKLRGGPQAAAEGVAILKKVFTDNPKGHIGRTARYELTSFQLKQAPSEALIGELGIALQTILDADPANPLGYDGRRELITAYLSLPAGAKPARDAELSPAMLKAIALAKQALQETVRAADAQSLVQEIVQALEARYSAHQAHAAAIKGVQSLLASPLPATTRLAALKALGLYQYRVAIEWLDDEARAGRLPAAVKDNTLPPALAEVVAVYQTIRTEYPTEPLWTDQAGLAAQVRGRAARVVWPEQVASLRGPDAWAIAIALPVVKTDADPSAVKAAVELVQGIVNEYKGLEQPAARQLTVATSRLLVAAQPSPRQPAWAGVMTAHAALLNGYAKYLFGENVKAGQGEMNAKLSDVQKEFLDTLAKLVAGDAQQAPAALNLVADHVKLWTDSNHWAVAEEVYATLAKALPESERRQADLAVVGLWTEQVLREHQRLSSLGLIVPRELDPILKKVLLRCHELQAGLEPTNAKLLPVRAAWDKVVAHYKSLDYDDVAEAAVKAKPEKAVEAADEYAAFQLVQLQDEQARRELARLLKQYGGPEKIAVTPALKATVAAWMKFIIDHPSSPSVHLAAERIFGIGRLFEQQGAFDVAAGLYADLAKFAAGVKVLSPPSPGASSTAERASCTRAFALDAQARKLLAKATADRRSGDPPPAKLSDEFAAAIAAYKAFVETYPESLSAGDAIGRVMAVALEYARLDAWDVADSVYADLLKSNLKIRRPERLEFARGLCQLGRAMPDHAREVLGALTSGGLRGSAETTEAAMLAGLLGPGDGATGGGRAAGPSSGPGPGVMMPPATEPAAPRAPPPPAKVAPSTVSAPATPGEKPSDEHSAEAQRDTQLLAMIRKQEANRATQVAQLREGQSSYRLANQPVAQGQAKQQAEQAPPRPVLSAAELARQENAIAAAYEIFQGIRKGHPDTPTAEQSRGEILVMAAHWRTLSEWQRSAALAVRFLTDNPADRQLPQLRLEIARDRLAWAAKPIEKKVTKQAMLAEVSSRFAAARTELAKIVTDFPKQRSYQQEAQWDIANSFLSEARVVGAVSPTLARGQFVRATRELHAVAEKYPSHPQIGAIPQMLWDISQELEGRGYDEEAILVWNELRIHDPMNPLAQQAALRIAQTYHTKLKRPLKAAEAYLELNFARGGNDQDSQNAMFQIGLELKNQKRWVEALHVLESFVDIFPRHAQAGQALTMAGQIHQTNEAWKDAIAAYKRVIAEYKDGQWVRDAKWSIAECTINLSQWSEATAAYRDFVAAYAQDKDVAEANRRIEILKDLARYQGLVDEKGQRKAFDAQYQIGSIVRSQLSNPVKAIIEYRKVAANWPESYVAANALYDIGNAYLSLGETEKARDAMQQVAEKYPTSPLASAALFAVGKSYEEEADKLATVTREKSIEQNKEVAQRIAYDQARSNLRRQQGAQMDIVTKLKSAGKGKSAEVQEAANAFNFGQFNDANTLVFAQKAEQEMETLTATQLADRQDKIDAALRKAVAAYTATSKIAGGNKADAALLQMATIYDQRLKDSKAAMETWLEIVRQFSGTPVAEDASWKIAQYQEREGKFTDAVEAYTAFLRNYRRSPNAGAAQFAVAENYERLGQWVRAMDSYNSYINNFPEGPLVAKAKEQINWIKTYRL